MESKEKNNIISEVSNVDTQINPESIVNTFQDAKNDIQNSTLTFVDFVDEKGIGIRNEFILHNPTNQVFSQTSPIGANPDDVIITPFMEFLFHTFKDAVMAKMVQPEKEQ